MYEGTFLEQVKRKLGGERGEVFYSLCQMAKVEPNDPEAALAMAIASLYVDARELGPEIGKHSASMQDAMSKFVAELPALFHRELGAAVTQALDGTVVEVQRMIRDMVTAETSATTVVRTAAIDDEVKKLRGVIEQYVGERAKLEGAQRAAGDGPASNAPVHAATVVSASVMALVCMLCVVTALLSFIAGMRFHPATVHAPSHVAARR